VNIVRALLIVALLASCAAPASPPASSTIAPSQSVAASTAAASQGPLPITNGQLAAGTYQTLVFQPQMTLTLPDGGWTLTAGEAADRVSDFVHSGPGADQQISFGVFRLGQTFNVFPDPCHPERVQDTTAVGKSREALVAWLARFPLLGASQPTPIAIHGRQGVEVKLVLDDAALAKCPDGQAALWGNGEGVLSLPPGSDDRLIILDVGGQMILVPWSVGPESATATLEPEIRKVLDTLTFADR
jgi:hypothetical protein